MPWVLSYAHVDCANGVRAPDHVAELHKMTHLRARVTGIQSRVIGVQPRVIGIQPNCSYESAAVRGVTGPDRVPGASGAAEQHGARRAQRAHCGWRCARHGGVRRVSHPKTLAALPTRTQLSFATVNGMRLIA